VGVNGVSCKGMTAQQVTSGLLLLLLLLLFLLLLLLLLIIITMATASFLLAAFSLFDAIGDFRLT
jgi:hypothetical protein